MMVFLRNSPRIHTTCIYKFKSSVAASHNDSTVDESEINHHNKLADKWWDEAAEMKPLHSLNKLRIKLIGTGLQNAGCLSYAAFNSSEPFKGIKLLEVGCGGGILTEPLARLGADVTGLDASLQMISTARAHAVKDLTISSRLCYIHGTIEEHVNVNVDTYDMIVASEVLEHLTQKQLFIQSCVKALKPGGSFFITSINKTLVSWLGAIVSAEKIFKLVPNGTHQWEKFLKPKELEIMLDHSGCDTRLVHGMFYNPITNQWHWVFNKNINYSLHSVKRTYMQQFH